MFVQPQIMAVSFWAQWKKILKGYYSCLPGEVQGDFTKASGLGATGWTGRVCLAASFLRLTCLFWNISSMLSCFWKTFCTCSYHCHRKKKSLSETYQQARQLFMVHWFEMAIAFILHIKILPYSSLLTRHNLQLFGTLKNWNITKYFLCLL